MGFYPFRGPDASFTRRQSYRMAPRSAKPFPREGMGREFCSRFLDSRPSPRPSPRVRGEGEDFERDGKPRVPLALHPGLQIFRP